MKKKVFVSFDYENDKDIKGALIKQAESEDCPFKIVDMSIKKPIDEKWKRQARSRIGNCDCVIVLCGEHTQEAAGVTAEITIARELKIPYILLKGRRKKNVQKPLSTLKEDKIYTWTWDNLRRLLSGERF